jgi:hypothetical protein
MSNPIGIKPTVTPASAEPKTLAPEQQAMTGVTTKPIESGLRAKRFQRSSSVPSFAPIKKSNKEEILKNLGIGNAQNAVAKLTDEARKIIAGFAAIKMTLPETSKTDLMKGIRNEAHQNLRNYINNAAPNDVSQIISHLINAAPETLTEKDLNQAKEALTNLSKAIDRADYQAKLEALKNKA